MVARVNTLQFITVAASRSPPLGTPHPAAMVACHVTLHISLSSIWLQHKTLEAADKAIVLSTIACLVHSSRLLIGTFKPHFKPQEIPLCHTLRHQRRVNTKLVLCYGMNLITLAFFADSQLTIFRHTSHYLFLIHS